MAQVNQQSIPTDFKTGAYKIPIDKSGGDPAALDYESLGEVAINNIPSDLPDDEKQTARERIGADQLHPKSSPDPADYDLGTIIDLNGQLVVRGQDHLSGTTQAATFTRYALEANVGALWGEDADEYRWRGQFATSAGVDTPAEGDVIVTHSGAWEEYNTVGAHIGWRHLSPPDEWIGVVQSEQEAIDRATGVGDEFVLQNEIIVVATFTAGQTTHVIPKWESLIGSNVKFEYRPDGLNGEPAQDGSEDNLMVLTLEPEPMVYGVELDRHQGTANTFTAEDYSNTKFLGEHPTSFYTLNTPTDTQVSNNIYGYNTEREIWVRAVTFQTGGEGGSSFNTWTQSTQSDAPYRGAYNNATDAASHLRATGDAYYDRDLGQVRTVLTFTAGSAAYFSRSWYPIGHGQAEIVQLLVNSESISTADKTAIRDNLGISATAGDDAALSGNTIESLFDNTDSGDTALTRSGAVNWANDIKITLDRAIDSDDDGKTILGRFTYRVLGEDVSWRFELDAEQFRKLTLHTATTGTGHPDDYIPVFGMRHVVGDDDITDLQVRAWIIARNRTAEGDDIIRATMQDAATQQNFTNMRGTVTLIPSFADLGVTGGMVDAELEGNDVTELYDNTDSGDTALTRASAAWNNSNDIKFELSRALAEADDDMIMVIKWKYDYGTSPNVHTVHNRWEINAGDFRNADAHTLTAGTGTDSQTAPTERFTFGAQRTRVGETTYSSAARAWLVSRNRHTDGHDVVRIAMADSGTMPALSEIRATITLVPRVDALSISGAMTSGGQQQQEGVSYNGTDIATITRYIQVTETAGVVVEPSDPAETWNWGEGDNDGWSAAPTWYEDIAAAKAAHTGDADDPVWVATQTVTRSIASDDTVTYTATDWRKYALWDDQYRSSPSADWHTTYASDDVQMRTRREDGTYTPPWWIGNDYSLDPWETLIENENLYGRSGGTDTISFDYDLSLYSALRWEIWSHGGFSTSSGNIDGTDPTEQGIPLSATIYPKRGVGWRVSSDPIGTIPDSHNYVMVYDVRGGIGHLTLCERGNVAFSTSVSASTDGDVPIYQYCEWYFYSSNATEANVSEIRTHDWSATFERFRISIYGLRAR